VSNASDAVVLAAGIDCYELESVCRLRKYLSFVELALSFVTSRLIFVSGWSELVKAQVMMMMMMMNSAVRIFEISNRIK